MFHPIISGLLSGKIQPLVRTYTIMQQSGIAQSC